MNGTDFLADTNALIYLLNGNSCMRPFLQSKLAFSVISENASLLCKNGLMQELPLRRYIKAFVSIF